jgi:fructose-specific phosphotransferase system IIC component
MCRPSPVVKEDVVQPERGLWRAVRWPLLVLVVAVLGIAVAAVLDRTASRELALTIGGPALTVLLPVGLVWLVVAVIVDVVRRRG